MWCKHRLYYILSFQLRIDYSGTLTLHRACTTLNALYSSLFINHLHCTKISAILLCRKCSDLFGDSKQLPLPFCSTQWKEMYNAWKEIFDNNFAYICIDWYFFLFCCQRLATIKAHQKAQLLKLLHCTLCWSQAKLAVENLKQLLFIFETKKIKNKSQKIWRLKMVVF